jgi:hypothetical protein
MRQLAGTNAIRLRYICNSVSGGTKTTRNAANPAMPAVLRSAHKISARLVPRRAGKGEKLQAVNTQADTL